MSDSFDHQLASTGPSTLPRVVNYRNMAAAMMESLSGQIGTSIVTTLFPVSVVSVDGDQVVLSQGGDTVQAGQRWQAVRLGEELKDPQTGSSLGRSEHPCCTIRIDRVAAQTSYGTIEDGVDAMRGGFRPGQIELRQKLGSKPAAAAAGATASTAPAAAARPTAKPKPGRRRPYRRSELVTRPSNTQMGSEPFPAGKGSDLRIPSVSTKVDTHQQQQRSVEGGWVRLRGCLRHGCRGQAPRVRALCLRSTASQASERTAASGWAGPRSGVYGVPATGPTPPSHRMPASAVAVAPAVAAALASAGAGRSPAESHYTPEGFPCWREQ